MTLADGLVLSMRTDLSKAVNMNRVTVFKDIVTFQDALCFISTIA